MSCICSAGVVSISLSSTMSSVAIHYRCGIANPPGYASLVTYIYELAVLDSNGFCMYFRLNIF